MNEGSLKSELVRLLRESIPEAMVFRHEDKYTAGIPDISVTWHGRTSWWEVKFIKPTLEKDTGVQWVTTCKLAREGVCFYIIYQLKNGAKRTYIVAPRDLSRFPLGQTGVEGFNHTTTVAFIMSQHANRLVVAEFPE